MLNVTFECPQLVGVCCIQQEWDSVRTVRPTHPRKSSDVTEGRAVVSVMMSASPI